MKSQSIEYFPPNATERADVGAELQRILIRFGDRDRETRLISEFFYADAQPRRRGDSAVAEIFGTASGVDPMESGSVTLGRWRRVTRELLARSGLDAASEPWLYGWLMYGAVLCERVRWFAPAAWTAVCAAALRAGVQGAAELPLSLAATRGVLGDERRRQLQGDLYAALVE